MRQKITICVFFALLLGFFTLVMVLPKDEKASVMENRPLAKMPEVSFDNIFKGEFCTEYETYLTDNVAFRSNFVRFGTFIEEIRGIQLTGKGRTVDLPSGTKLVLNDGKIMEVYKENPQSAAMYIDVLNKYSEKFSGDINIYSMLVPTQIEFDNSEYRKLSDSQKNTIDYIYSSLNNIKTVNVYDALKEHCDEYIYFRTDHHWTQRGAYYGYRSIMEAKGENAVPLEDMKYNKLTGFLGYLYNQANVKQYSKYADDIEYFEIGENYPITIKGVEDGKSFEYQKNIYNIPPEGQAVTYGIFMDGDHQLAEINTNNKNGEVALVIKDSYANAVLPLLTGHYEKILVIDPRSFGRTVTELTQEYEIDDIIFINYAMTTTMPAFIESVGNIL